MMDALCAGGCWILGMIIAMLSVRIYDRRVDNKEMHYYDEDEF